jgi:predicted SnoaL-like aldol condensation-catalyzing enzyme
MEPHASPTAESNRQAVLAFYHLGLQGRQPQQAFERYMSPNFVEHKPDVETPTREGASAFLAELMVELPEATWEVVRTIAEEDMVFLHARFSPSPEAPEYAIADIFRLRDGLIVEHWDVVASPHPDPKNPQSRF